MDTIADKKSTSTDKLSTSANPLPFLNEKIIECRLCPRLVRFRESIARKKKKQFQSSEYWGRPVPGFGDAAASLVIIGLAPAPHGGNRTGRVFTGDKSADFLVRALYETGFANQPYSRDAYDGLDLYGAYMTAAVKCAPPDNKPTREEMSNCAPYLRQELQILNRSKALLCLGHFAYNAIMMLLPESLAGSVIPKFAHGLEIDLKEGRKLFASYHPSPRNTQTRKLTSDMFRSVLLRIRTHLCAPT